MTFRWLCCGGTQRICRCFKADSAGEVHRGVFCESADWSVNELRGPSYRSEGRPMEFGEADSTQFFGTSWRIASLSSAAPPAQRDAEPSALARFFYSWDAARFPWYWESPLICFCRRGSTVDVGEIQPERKDRVHHGIVARAGRRHGKGAGRSGCERGNSWLARRSRIHSKDAEQRGRKSDLVGWRCSRWSCLRALDWRGCQPLWTHRYSRE